VCLSASWTLPGAAAGAPTVAAAAGGGNAAARAASVAAGLVVLLALPALLGLAAGRLTRPPPREPVPIRARLTDGTIADGWSADDPAEDLPLFLLEDAEVMTRIGRETYDGLWLPRDRITSIGSGTSVPARLPDSPAPWDWPVLANRRQERSPRSVERQARGYGPRAASRLGLVGAPPSSEREPRVQVASVVVRPPNRP
jgi:hypothetical protein